MSINRVPNTTRITRTASRAGKIYKEVKNLGKTAAKTAGGVIRGAGKAIRNVGRGIKNLFPSKYTNTQRENLALAKINQGKFKSAVSETGKTVRSIGTQLIANRAIESHQAAKDMAIQQNNDQLNKAIALYEQIVGSNPDKQGSSGGKSTTDVGGGGSAISGR